MAGGLGGCGSRCDMEAPPQMRLRAPLGQEEIDSGLYAGFSHVRHRSPEALRDSEAGLCAGQRLYLFKKWNLGARILSSTALLQ